MKRVFSMLCVLALMLGMLAVPAYATDAEGAVQQDRVVLSANAENLTVEEDTYIDLNGYSIAGVTVKDGATLYVSDSQTDDYTVTDGIYGKITDAEGNVQAAEGYVAITEDGAVSYHKADLTLTSMTLRPAAAGVYYNSAFAADEVVAANVECYGVALSVVAEPTAENLDTLCGYSTIYGFEAGEKSGTLLSGIMTEGNTDFANDRNAAMAIYGRAYIKTAEGYIFGATASRNLKEQVEAIDAIFAELSDAQKAAITSMYSKYQTVMENWNVSNMKHAAPVGDTVITVPVETEDGEVTETVTVEQDGVSITIPFGTLVESNELTLTVTRLDASESEIEAGEGQTLMPFDVHVDGISAENTQPLTVALGKVMPENLNMGNYTVYHVEEDGTKEMELVASAEDLTDHNQFVYTLDGELTLNMANFSEVAALTENDNAWAGRIDYTWYDAAANELYIRNADQLAGLNKIVSGDAGEIAKDSFENKTVKLLSDLNFAGSVWYPIGYWAPGTGANAAGENEWYTYGGGFSGTFDGNGNTVSNISQNTWALNGNYDYGYWDEAMGLFGYVYNGTVKNLTVKNFYSEGEFTPTGCVTAFACDSTFENIALVNCNPRVYNTGNGGIVGIGGNSDDPDTYKLTFNNITIDNSNKITALWGSWDVACGGLIGMFRGAGHVYMNNCHIAAQIDVYNDVCGNYQYYWYRYSGMLVGTNKNMTTDDKGYTVPETDKFHAENCTVHFGTWNNYWYCELVANSLASYTHDHQFSRLTQINSVADIQDENSAWTKTGNYLVIDGDTKTCYHIVKNADGELVRHLHEDAGYETSIDEDGDGNVDLKEDKQIVYLPFNQLFTGYGWGVKHVPLGEFGGVTILDREIADSVDKFNGIANGAEYVSGTTVTIGDLFAAADQNNVAIVPGNVQVTVSPADDESTAGGTYAANTTDWTQGTLTFSGMGEAIITITDYYFCSPTTIKVEVTPIAKIGETGYALLQDALDAARDGDTVILQDNVMASEYLDVYTANNGETERAITLNLNGNTIAPAANYNYKWYPLIFVGINQTLTIQNGTVLTDEHTAIGVYGSLNLENVNVVKESGTEEAVCIWNWGEDDKYYEDCQLQLTGSANIKGGNITGGILIEGPVTFNETAKFDKLYLNTKTGHGKYILPNGYGLVKEETCYTTLHKHTLSGGACTVEGCGYAFTSTYVKTDLAEIQSTDVVVVTMTKDGKTYALLNSNGTVSAPEAVIIEVDGETIAGGVADTILWNINKGDDGLTFYPNGSTSTWLYCTNTNNGVRVGTGAAKHFVVDGETGYLKITETTETRYIGVYNSQDWRCYKLDDGKIQSNIAEQTLAFYVLKTDCKHANVEERGEIAATCTLAGHEAGTYCLDCNTYTDGGKMFNANGHDFGDPKSSVTVDDCKVKNTYRCSVCNKVSVKTVSVHTWTEATCTDPKTCSVCGTTEGEALGHNWTAATCTDAKVCSVCGTTDGSAMGHNWNDATCTAPKTCSVCGATEGEALGHNWTAATCTAPKTCSVCGATEGEALGHNWTAATCTAPKTCSVCGETEGATADHTYVDGTCTVCGTSEPNEVTVNATITFDSTAKRTEFSTSKQVWEENGITVTNNKGTGNNIADYANPVRFYKSSELIITAPGNITKIQFTCSSTSYAEDLRSSIAGSTINGSVVTVELDGSSVDFTATMTVGQVRVNSITVTYTTTTGGETPEEPCTHTNTTTSTVDATCTADGSITVTCDDCQEVISKETSNALGHNYVEGTCSRCEAENPDFNPGTTETQPLATFNLGANGTATHADGSSGTSYTETVGDYTLSLTGGTSMYTGARDAKGNGCIKLGTSSKTGGFSFTVPENVTKVVIYIAKYKSNTTKINVNGTAYTLTKNSNDGAYDVIEIDTSTTKTVTLTTVSGGYRAMVNTIEFYKN